MAPIRVLVADAQRLFAEALAVALSDQPDMMVIPEHPVRGDDALEAAARHRPDVVVYDLWMAGTDGAAAARALRSWAPSTKVLILSAFHGGRHVQRALTAGAAASVPKSVPLEDLVIAVRRVHAANGPVDTRAALGRVVDDNELPASRHQQAWERLSQLSPREVEILQALCEGGSLKVLAGQLSISVGTLKNHIHNILVKTGTQTQLEAIAIARRSGLVRETGPPPPRQSKSR